MLRVLSNRSPAQTCSASLLQALLVHAVRKPAEIAASGELFKSTARWCFQTLLGPKGDLPIRNEDTSALRTSPRAAETFRQLVNNSQPVDQIDQACQSKLGCAIHLESLLMMAAEGSDPKTFGSWEDAFQYPVAHVRGLERQLRNDIGSNKEKLRTLVGYDVESSFLESPFFLNLIRRNIR